MTRTAGGRPLVVVASDYSHLPEVNVIVRNFTQAPARDVSFEFSAPVESPESTVLSELPYLKEGLPFLEPGASISRPWGCLPDLAPLLREKGLEAGIGVTTRYRDLAGERYESEWTLNPLLLLGSGIETSRGMNDLVWRSSSRNVAQNRSRRTKRRPGPRGTPVGARPQEAVDFPLRTRPGPAAHLRLSTAGNEPSRERS